jgi:hypothetical protein
MPTSLTYAGPERRVDRLTVPRCETCGSPQTAVVGRTDYWLYVRCSGLCLHVECLQTRRRTGGDVRHADADVGWGRLTH